MALTFIKPRLMTFNGSSVTDHNRSELQIQVERIEDKKRMANGTLRKYVVADKRTFSTSWEMLPAIASKTVDGYWGANEIEDFFDAQKGAFTLQLFFGSSGTETYTVMIESFSKTLNKRGSVDMYDVSITLEEV